MDAKVEWSGEPETPRWLEWRLVIYPIALGVGALAVSTDNPLVAVLLFVAFAVLMLAPIVIKWRAWGGIARALRWLFTSNVTIRREGFLFVTFVFVFGVAAINTGTNLLYLIFAMLIAIMIMSSVMANMNLRGLRVSRRMPGYVFAGEPFRIHIVITNPRRIVPAFVIEARERAGPFGLGGAPKEGGKLFWWSIEPGERKALAFTVEGIPRRGVYPLEGFTLTTRFPFGFTEQRAGADLPAEVVVFPSPRPLAGEASRSLDVSLEVPRPRSFATSPEEFRSLREYRPRDNPRWIHWKSSARAGRLLVKEFEPRASRRAFIAVDSAADVEGEEAVRALDRVATLAASVLEHLAQQGERPEVAVVAGAEVVRFGPEMGPRETTALLECLARLAPAADPGEARLVEAALPGLRSGARVYVVSARDPAAVRGRLERADPPGAERALVMDAGDARRARRWYAEAAEAEAEARKAPAPAPGPEPAGAMAVAAAGAGA